MAADARLDLVIAEEDAPGHTELPVPVVRLTAAQMVTPFDCDLCCPPYCPPA
ncbi:hypothetical protein OIB37_35620 [Streptomyces sp. NBC_00820]|uniref:hypothetical protein n=1 Tax=Streptomyces sp. NBC_00820 TaxID=2975842 RepID=UPI002ED59451|nr:hypothetical protein OIB37_35620 [Streptomyces sp. NBC_00820]